MASDYGKIRTQNIREYGHGTRHLAFLRRLYADRTHFVFELLQNAEDAGATQVRFELHPDRLEVSHDGRPFDEADVRGICGVGEGTKEQDLTQIGKFGIGFKSVYAYTRSPEIHSGPENFRIDHCVRPHSIAAKHSQSSRTTLFVLPFDGEDIDPVQAFAEITQRLSRLGPRTLLFLRNIETIEWSIPNSQSGVFTRQSERMAGPRKVLVAGQSDDQKKEGEEEEEWLIFDRPVQLPGDLRAATVEIAFRLWTDQETGKADIIKVDSTPLVVFFPTEKETRFSFLIQGPYRTTPSRDNVPKDDAWNNSLIEETAQLMVDVVPKLKEMGLLTTNALEALPVRLQEYPKNGMFQPVIDAVRSVLARKPLLRAADGTYVRAKNAKLAKGSELRKLLTNKQLSALYDNVTPLYWLDASFSQARFGVLREYLMKELQVEEVTSDTLARKIKDSFLAKQSDKWMISFYAFLTGHEHLWCAPRWFGDSSEGILRKKELIRLTDGLHVIPFNSDGRPNAFLFSDDAEGYPLVKKRISASRDAREFLERLGLRETEDRDKIQSILDSYYRHDSSNLTRKQHLGHIRRFIQWYKVESDTDPFEGAYLFLPQDGNTLNTPDSFYLDAPFKQTGLSAIYGDLEETDIEERLPLWDAYKNLKGFVEFALALGVREKLIIERKSTNTNTDSSFLRQDYNRPRRRWTNSVIDEDYTIEGIADLLDKQNFKVSQVLWNFMCGASPRILRARFRPNQHYPIREALSQLVHCLRKAAWIPDLNGVFRTSREMTKDMLPSELKYDDRNNWLTEIQFGENARQRSLESEQKKLAELRRKKKAEELGVTIDDVDFIKKWKEISPDEYERAKNRVTTTQKPIFPEKSSGNPERRRTKVSENMSTSSPKNYETRNRSVRTSRSSVDPETRLREYYTNDDGQMVCQICQEEMPFRKRDGEYYFEAVEAFTDLEQEHEDLYLALCPLCSAMYKEFIKSDEEMMTAFKSLLQNSIEPDIHIRLGDRQTSVRFVETHLRDLQVILGQPVAPAGSSGEGEEFTEEA